MNLKERIIRAYRDGISVADLESDADSYALEYVAMIGSEQIAQRCLASECSVAAVRDKTIANQVRGLSRGFLERIAFDLGYYFYRSGLNQ